MKNNIFLTTIMTLLLALSISAQEKVTDFSGSWELDVSKSKLDERMRVESMTMNVAQTENNIKIETTAKRAENSGGGSGMNRGGNQILTYNLDGKETQIQQDSPMGQMPVTLKAKMDGAKMNLSSTRTLKPQMGEMTIITNETWSLSEDGKTLTVKRETQTPRGSNSSEMVFAKKDSTNISANKIGGDSNLGIPKTISGGVVNGKARNLVVPKYPDEARAARAAGTVSVQVVIDEAGNVISAKAVSGDPLLLNASEQAALASKFNPTLLQGVPVRVTGFIIYNFVP